MTYQTGRAFWYDQAAFEQRRACDTAEDARTYTDRAERDGHVTLTLARALQVKAARQYVIARSAIVAAEELPE